MKLYDGLWQSQSRPMQLQRRMELPLTPRTVPERPANLTSADEVVEFRRLEKEIKDENQMRQLPLAVIREVGEVARRVAGKDAEKEDYDTRPDHVILCQEDFVAEAHPAPEGSSFTAVDGPDPELDRIGWHYSRQGAREVYERVRRRPQVVDCCQVICDPAKGTLTYLNWQS